MIGTEPILDNWLDATARGKIMVVEPADRL
jgi:hypothetical protein